MSGTDRLGAHAALWYADVRYRLAWLVLPQAVVALLAGLSLSLLKPAAEWGKPADSKESEKLYLDLLDKAGNAGDKAAFDKLQADADAGNISARSFMGVLYDPDLASLYPKNPVKPDAAKALSYYQKTADLGYRGAQRGMTELLLNRGRGQYDLKRGCRYGLALYNNPVAMREKYSGASQALYWIAGCFMDAESGVPRDPQKAADIYMDTVVAKLPLAIGTFTDDLGRQPPDLVAAIQRNLTQRGFYSGPIDGSVTPQTVAAVRALAGKASAPPNGGGGGDQDSRKEPPPGPVPSADALIALFKSAPTNSADAAKLRGYAESGVSTAQYLYANLISPANTQAGQIAPDAALAAQYLERLVRERSFGPAANSAAFLYDLGGANLPRDPEKAADMTIRALELKTAEIMQNLEQDKWGVGYWAALQQRLADRHLYKGRIVDKRNDRTIEAARGLLGNP